MSSAEFSDTWRVWVGGMEKEGEGIFNSQFEYFGIVWDNLGIGLPVVSNRFHFVNASDFMLIF